MSLTPMMKQYLEVKERCEDCILFFRLGDFYEMFFKDAETASRELELVLTGRDCGLEERAPMCGIPYHAASNYISRLVQKGYKIAICEQLEDPALAKGIVKRDIIKIVTPGTFTDSSFLNEGENNYIMSLFSNEATGVCGMSFSDISTGEFNCTLCPNNISTILDEISKFHPREILIQQNLDEKLVKAIMEKFNISFSKYDNEYFCTNSLKNINNHFKTLDTKDIDDCILYSCNGLLNYIKDTQKITLSNIDVINIYNIVDYLTIDANSRRNLELTETLRDKTKKGSLLWVLDKTSTAMGTRELRRWIDQPLVRKCEIDERLDSVKELVESISLTEDLKIALKEIYDIERLAGKISSQSINAKEMIALKNSISNIPKVKEILSKLKSSLFKKMYRNLDELEDIYNLINESINENPSLSLKEGDIIKDGFNPSVDELRGAKTHGKEWIARLENSEKEVTGIKSLKVGFNKVFGYFIEIRKTNLELVPKDRYIRKQTLANAERYITEELKEVEEKLLGAEGKLIDLEYSIFVEIREKIEKEIGRLKNSAKIISAVDCLCSLATVALENNYCKPNINEKGNINIVGGRHPVVEKVINTGSFIENDVLLDQGSNRFLLITGPNMAGKSTYMRQIALITILAQMGSFVPAKSADISICDKIFTRIGASDDLASGKSTFMVEMWEVANILKNATNKSLILLDEVGRGTSTYDGLSIAWAVIEYICSTPHLKSKTLFATHYHELTKLEGKIDGLKNYSVSVKEDGKDIVFLRKIVEGGADQSYGIQVAKLAGLPEDVLKRADEILKDLEGENNKYVVKEVGDYVHCNAETITNSIKDTDGKSKSYSKVDEVALDLQREIKESKGINKTNENNKNSKISDINEINDIIKENSSMLTQLNFSDIEKENLLNYIKSIDVLKLNPMEGFNKLYEIIERAKSI